MPGKMIPVKGRVVKGASKKPKGKRNAGAEFIPDFTKPKGNRRRVLDAINQMNKDAGY